MNKTKFFTIIFITLFVITCTLVIAEDLSHESTGQTSFKNSYHVPEDLGDRVNPTYFLRRAWVQISRDLSKTDVPPTINLDLDNLGKQSFAVAWLGHAAMLVRVGELWVLIDPAMSKTAGPVQGLGPERLTRLPIALEVLPHIDVVLISHNHYDHLDLNTVRALAKQSGGAPKYLVGRGLGIWFRTNVNTNIKEFDWWDGLIIGNTNFRFVPAQHNSGRTPFQKNTHLWGGWVISHASKQFYFPGDTAYVEQLFKDIRDRVGPIDLAALPIGAYQPRRLMRFEHFDPEDAVKAHVVLNAKTSFGVHWGTFQLGDEELFEPASDLSAALKKHGINHGFGLMAIGSFISIDESVRDSLLLPDQLSPTKAKKN